MFWRPMLSTQRDNVQQNRNYFHGLYRGYIGIMEKNMEIIMETTIMDYIGVMIGVDTDARKDNGSYYLGLTI